MTTTMTLNRKKVTLTIEEKARALTVFDIDENNHLACTSGTDSNNAYVVCHNGKVSTHCPCGSYKPGCSHRLAVDWYLEAKNRAVYLVMFDPHLCDCSA